MAESPFERIRQKESFRLEFLDDLEKLIVRGDARDPAFVTEVLTSAVSDRQRGLDQGRNHSVTPPVSPPPTATQSSQQNQGSLEQNLKVIRETFAKEGRPLSIPELIDETKIPRAPIRYIFEKSHTHEFEKVPDRKDGRSFLWRPCSWAEPEATETSEVSQEIESNLEARSGLKLSVAVHQWLMENPAGGTTAEITEGVKDIADSKGATPLSSRASAALANLRAKHLVTNTQREDGQRIWIIPSNHEVNRTSPQEGTMPSFWTHINGQGL